MLGREYLIGVVFVTLVFSPQALAQDMSRQAPGSRRDGTSPQHVQSRLAHQPNLHRQYLGHPYQGKHAWQAGHWRQESRRGRYGWWWDTGGFGYFYDAPFEGPPDYVSEIEEPEQTAGPQLQQQREPLRAYFFKSGDQKGVSYNTLEECKHAYENAEKIGFCILK
jgi:hypothetical protein